MKKIILILLLLNLNNHVYSIEPDVFVQSTVNRASQVLSKNISKKEKINELKIIAKNTVDITGVGFYSLGSTRKNLDENQLLSETDFTEHIKEIIVNQPEFLKSISVRYEKNENKTAVIAAELRLRSRVGARRRRLERCGEIPR